MTIMRIRTVEHSSVSNFNDIVIDIENRPLLRFESRFYMKIASKNGDSERILEIVNMFFDSLSLGDQEALQEMYDQAHMLMLYTLNHNLCSFDVFIEELERIVNETITEYSLINKMLHFAKTNETLVGSYPDLSEAGSWEGNTHRRTFGLEEYQEMTAIMLLCKTMIPIWALLAGVLENRDIRTEQIESIQYRLISELLHDEAIVDVNTRFEEMIVSGVERKVQRQIFQPQFYDILNKANFTKEAFIDLIRNSLFVKRMSQFIPLRRPEDEKLPNLMVFLDNGIKFSTDTKLGMLRYRFQK